MRYEYIGPFVDSAVKVLHEVIRRDVARGDISLVRADTLDEGISIIIDLNGDSSGHVVLNMDEDTALRISDAIAGPKFSHPIPIADSLSELANMIVGNAASTLNDLGFDSEVSVPVVAPQEKLLEKTACLELLRVPLFTDCGEVTVNIGLRTN